MHSADGDISAQGLGSYGTFANHPIWVEWRHYVEIAEEEEEEVEDDWKNEITSPTTIY